jgi:hypothetical protein
MNPNMINIEMEHGSATEPPTATLSIPPVTTDLERFVPIQPSRSYHPIAPEYRDWRHPAEPSGFFKIIGIESTLPAVSPSATIHQEFRTGR